MTVSRLLEDHAPLRGELTDGLHLLDSANCSRAHPAPRGCRGEFFRCACAARRRSAGEAQRHDADHEQEMRDKPPPRAPRQRTAAEKMLSQAAKPKRMSNAVAVSRGPRRNAAQSSGTSKNGQRRRGPHIGRQWAEGDRSERARRRENNGRFQKRRKSNDAASRSHSTRTGVISSSAARSLSHRGDQTAANFAHSTCSIGAETQHRDRCSC